jgi:hypothetical protein
MREHVLEARTEFDIRSVLVAVGFDHVHRAGAFERAFHFRIGEARAKEGREFRRERHLEHGVEIQTARAQDSVQRARRHGERGVAEVAQVVVATLHGEIFVELVATEHLEARVALVVVHEGGGVSLLEQVGGDAVFVHVGFRRAAVYTDVPARIGGDGQGGREDCERRKSQRRRGL